MVVCTAIRMLHHQPYGFRTTWWRTPTEWLLGYTPDITVLLQFYFYEPVYYQELDGKFPADPKECLGRFVGIAETVGNAITFCVLTASGKIILCSVVRSATKEGIYQNLRANERAPDLAPKEPNAELNLKGTPIPVVVSEKELNRATGPQGKTSMEGEVETVQEDQEGGSEEEPKVDDSMEAADGDEETEVKEKPSPEEAIRSAMEHIINKGGRMPTLNADHILGRTFITTPDEDGEQKRAKIVDIEATGEKALDGKQPLFKFKCEVGDEQF